MIVEPVDAELVRNRPFVDELAAVAKMAGIVVELSGGILSHAYYALTRAGAKIECVDLFGDEEEVIEFDKLVRDKVHHVITERGERAETTQVKGDALVLALKQKLVEEGLEVVDARGGEEIISELADVAEVSRSLAQAIAADAGAVEEARIIKFRKRGGFETGTMLIRTATPGTLASAHGPEGRLPVTGAHDRVISDPDALPARPVYRRPDLRQVGEALEKLLTLEVDLSRLTEGIREDLDFTLPSDDGGEGNYSLTVELRRVKGSLRAVVRVRRVESQLKLKMD